MGSAAAPDPLREACSLVWDILDGEVRQRLMHRFGISPASPNAFGDLVNRIGEQEFVRQATRMRYRAANEFAGPDLKPLSKEPRPAWVVAPGAPFSDVISTLLEQLGPSRLRAIVAAQGVTDLNWWLEHEADGREVADMLRRCRGAMRDPVIESQVWSLYLAEIRRLRYSGR